MSDIAALLERVRAATGPDRAIDGAIKMVAAAYMIAAGSPQKQVVEAVGGNLFDAPPCFTASVDAALALTERMLPGWRYDIHSPRFGTPFEAVLMDGDSASRKIVVDKAQTAPLAILAALLLALKDQPHD